ncbi:MAG: DUF4265 domain-containing protein [Micropruina sp.]|uniref:DUF4265 domain-containing protein n=1 Tax=Micropruina sp. TaxID=2737536 RepID=UPI0039E40C79
MIASHPDPVARPHPSYMLRVALDDVGPGENHEQLWTKQVGHDLYEICCIPFFADQLALGDVVRADSDYRIRSVVHRSRNGVVRIAIKRPEDIDSLHPLLHELLVRSNYLHEWFVPGYVAVNINPEESHKEFFADLSTLGDSIEVEHMVTPD